MARIQYAALLLSICAAPMGCKDATNSDLTDPEVVPDDLAAPTTMTAPLAFQRISAGTGNGHTCGVTTNSLAYCWGYNGTGAVGDGTTTRRLRPAAVAGMHRFQQVSAGYDFSCGITSEFRAYCWGSNNFGIHGGQLGDGTKTRRLRPVAVLGGLQFREVSTGVAHTCGRTTTNRVYCWGSNESGQIGDGTKQDRLTPRRVAGTLRFRQVSVGGNHSCGVTTDDRAYCWGQNASGAIGNGSNMTPVLIPTAVAGNHRFRQLDGGGFHTCGVTTDGRTFCWGDNLSGQLGDGTNTKRTRPRPVVGGLSFRGIEAGAQHTCGVTTTNLAYCWGNNQVGTLGDGTTSHRSAPVAVAGGHRFSQVSAGGPHSCGTTTAAAGYCWGENFNGALGDGTTTNRTRPRAVVGP
jgi:alpha-tubulin suppressor-like RCC1 family protein